MIVDYIRENMAMVIGLAVLFIFLIIGCIVMFINKKNEGKENNISNFFNKYKGVIDKITGLFIIVGILFIVVFLIYYSTLVSKYHIENENMRSEMIQMNQYRKQNSSKIICLNNSGVSVTKIDENYHFLYISDKGLAESADIPVNKTAIYYCNIEDDYYVDTYIFGNTEYYILYIPENTIYEVN